MSCIFCHIYDSWNLKKVAVTTGNLKILIIVVFICQTNQYSYYDTNKPQAAISHSGSVITFPFVVTQYKNGTDLHTFTHNQRCPWKEFQIPPEKVTSWRKSLLQIDNFFLDLNRKEIKKNRVFHNEIFSLKSGDQKRFERPLTTNWASIQTKPVRY